MSERDSDAPWGSEVTMGTVTCAPPGQGAAVEALLEGGRPTVVFGEVLGRGGMAVIRAGEQSSMRRSVAVKTARARTARDRLVQEAWVAGALEHPNIVPVYDIAVVDGSPHVVMKRIDGEAWSRYLRSPDELAALGVTDVLAWHLKILISVCHALECAHDQGIIHRDIKPANVMIGRFGEVYLLDWGLALRVDPTDDPDPRFPVTDAEGVGACGTPAYMAPEMLVTSGIPMSRRTDVYLLGAVLHRVVAGRCVRQASSLADLLRTLPIPARIDPSWPMASLLESALSIDPEGRPASVAAFREAVETYVARRASERILASAEEKRRALVALTTREDADEADRQQVYDLFGACRFGYEAVLRDWPDFHDARAGIREAIVQVARWELDHADDRSARVHLALLAEPPDDLMQRLEAAQLDREREAAELERLRADQDRASGWGWRIALAIGLGATWVGPPLVTGLIGVENGYPRQIGVSVATAVGTFVMLAVAWPWLRSSRYNRVLVAGVGLSPFLSSLLLTACWLGDVPGDEASALRMIAYVASSALVASLADWRFFPGVLGFVVALLVGARSPDLAETALGVANLAVVVNGLAIWMPAVFIRTRDR